MDGVIKLNLSNFVTIGLIAFIAVYVLNRVLIHFGLSHETSMPQ